MDTCRPEHFLIQRRRRIADSANHLSVVVVDAGPFRRKGERQDVNPPILRRLGETDSEFFAMEAP